MADRNRNGRFWHVIEGREIPLSFEPAQLFCWRQRSQDRFGLSFFASCRRCEHPSDDPFKTSKIYADYPKRKNDLVRSDFVIRPDGFGGGVARHVGASRLAGVVCFSQRNFVRSALTSLLTNPKCSKRSTIELLLLDRTSVIIGAPIFCNFDMREEETC